MTEYAYQPMGQRVCNTTTEQMFEKLHSRLSKTTEGHSPKAQSDDKQTDGRCHPSAALLAWEPKAEGANHIDETTGRYRISGAKVQGKPRYSAWRRPAVSGRLPDALGCTDTPDEAKQLCASHAAAETK